MIPNNGKGGSSWGKGWDGDYDPMTSDDYMTFADWNSYYSGGAFNPGYFASTNGSGLVSHGGGPSPGSLENKIDHHSNVSTGERPKPKPPTIMEQIYKIREELKSILPNVDFKFYNQMVITELFFTNARKYFDNQDWVVPGNKYIEKLRFFAEMVKTGAPMDIKQYGKGFSPQELGAKQAIFENNVYDFDDFGNINYGYAAKLFGISIDDAIKAAGIYQTFYQGNPDFSNLKGFFDALKDTKNIIFGYNFIPIWER